MPKYSNCTAKFKLNVLSFADKNGVKAAGRHFSVDPNSIRYWRRQKENLIASKKTTKSFRGPKTEKFPVIDNGVMEYVHQLRDDGCAVSYEMIQNIAREIARTLNINGD